MNPSLLLSASNNVTNVAIKYVNYGKYFKLDYNYNYWETT